MDIGESKAFEDIVNALESIAANMPEEVEYISIRDKFAMAALTGLIACPETEGTPSSFSAAAYRYADAMLAAGDK